jgi:Tfp pilus assembly protein PilO
MKQRLAARWNALDPRLRGLTVLAAVLLVVVEIWVLVLRPPVERYRALRAGNASLEQLASTQRNREEELGRVEADIAALEARLQGSLPGLTTEQMVVALVARLDRLARRHGVTLAGVKPGDSKPVLMFEEVSFDIKAMGTYIPLVAWLDEVRAELGPLVVTRFAIRAGAPGKPLDMELKIAAYRALPVER